MDVNHVDFCWSCQDDSCKPSEYTEKCSGDDLEETMLSE